MLKPWVIRLFVLLTVLWFGFLLIDTVFIVDEPDFCALCHAAPIHAPCLLNIETGNLTELRIYEPHPHLAGELAATQQGGYLGISMSGGIWVTSNPDAQTAETTIPLEKAKLNKSKFCNKCRKLLNDAHSKFILIDLHEPDNIIQYTIANGLCCEIRNYSISVSEEDNSSIKITVTGNMLSD